MMIGWIFSSLEKADHQLARPGAEGVDLVRDGAGRLMAPPDDHHHLRRLGEGTAHASGDHDVPRVPALEHPHGATYRTDEAYWLQPGPEGDLLIVISNRDQDAFMEIMANPQTDFDRWFRDQLQEVFGSDENAPPSPPNELLGRYPA